MSAPPTTLSAAQRAPAMSDRPSYILKLADGRTVKQAADDSFEAVCLVSAATGQRVVSFRKINAETEDPSWSTSIATPIKTPH